MTVGPAAEHLKDEVQRALHLLDKLTAHEPPAYPLGVLNPKALAACKGIFFYHSTKVGLGVGFKWGCGMLVSHLGESDANGLAAWSAPCLFKLHEGSVGLLAGAGSVSTMLVLGSEAAVERFSDAGTNGQRVLGLDADLTLGTSELGGSLAKDALNAFSTRDAMSFSLDSKGAILDMSLVGGKMSFDAEANAEIYGRDTSAEQILGAPASLRAPAALRPLYAALDTICLAAADDARPFSGFRKHWHPQNVLKAD